MMKTKASALIASLLVFLTGCIQYSGPHALAPDPLTFFRWAAIDHDVRVVVIGNPLAATQSEVDKAITDAFQRNYQSLNANFTTQPTGKVRDPFKIVAIFNPPVTLSAQRICRDTAAYRPEADDNFVRLHMVFCGGKAYSEMSARIVKTDDVNHPDFRKALIILASQIAPQEIIPLNRRED